MQTVLGRIYIARDFHLPTDVSIFRLRSPHCKSVKFPICKLLLKCCHTFPTLICVTLILTPHLLGEF